MQKVVVRDKELENAEKQIRSYQREVASLKLKLDAQSGYDRYCPLLTPDSVVELETQLRQAETTIQTQQTEIKTLKGIQKNHEKELGRVLGSLDYERKLKEQGEQLKAERARVKDLERKVVSDDSANTRLHTFVFELQEKYKRAREEHRGSLKKLDTGGSQVPAEDTAGNDRSEEDSRRQEQVEILQNGLKAMKRRFQQEMSSSRRTVASLKGEIESLTKRLKEAEQENRLNSYKLKESIRASRQLPLPSSPSPPLEKEEAKRPFRAMAGRPSRTPVKVSLGSHESLVETGESDSEISREDAEQEPAVRQPSSP